MKQFFKYFIGILDTTQKKRFFLYLVLLFLGSTSSMLGVGAVIPFVNALINPKYFDNIVILRSFSNFQIILISIVLLILAFWIKNIIGVILFWFQTKFLNSIVLDIQKKLFRLYILMDYESHLTRSTPTLIRNINSETNQLSSGIINPLGILMTDLFSCVFIVALLLYINFLFSFFTLLILGVSLFIFMLKIKGILDKYGKQRAEAWKSMTQTTMNGLSGIKEIKLYNKEKVFMSEFDEKAAMLNRSMQFNQIFQILPRFFIEAIAITFVLVTLLVLIVFSESINSIFILLSVFGVAATQLLPALNRIMQAITNIKYSIPALKVIYEELSKYQNYSDSIENSHQLDISFEKNIRLENISYSYPDGTQALKNISLTIEKGKKTAFIGPSGSGKSTLVDLLMGFYMAQSGSIHIDDKQINNTWIVQRLFAYIPQQIILYDTSIKQNIAFGEPKTLIDEAKVWKCLKIAQLDDFVSKLNKGLDTFVGENGVRLSGGQRQRLGIARALYQNPQILVMDEATSALDNEIEKEVTNVIKELKDITIITIAHRLSTIEGYDMVYSLNN
ncbi:ABC transporter ATP-binding protein [Francisella tularensis]|uniref:ABC transporter ATP-binding protein n=1 Tax=Francisella tularensis TaxID=263 RepID=UPI000173E2CC|nr:ABC transporter ATP-binding protein [Francisella tularensis]ACD30954.1 ATP-binding cassette (ABC) superfamily protein [Francisella tularensis subsp. mediasiatica FSC147]MBK2077764.1 ABC transporter ATP-binding protein [Francisella tularensis subsp. mediasiatica]MBK2101494.1 ABC transporter ATP-binding protein [Francisella tularensis subsp. mediasiatica]MBK2104185.1 ABC transporter ATP-binding protein [Francisella tularensis subsp. mediasiatica]MDN9003382.1 ABC transporter ATP-binding protei